MVYLAWKLLHVASVVIFLGNITTGLFWAAHAHKSRDFRLIASTFEGIIRSDRWFTLPGVAGIVIAGVAAAMENNLPILSTGWILWPVILFSISGIVFGIWVAPLQRKIVQLVQAAEGAAGEGPAWDAYQTMYKRWEYWGLLALGTPVTAFVLMVLKPSLPSW